MYSCSCLVERKFLARFVSNLGEIFGARRILVFNLRKLLTRNQNFFSLGELKTPPGLFLVYERRAKVRHNAWEASVSAAYIVIFTSRTICSASMIRRLFEDLIKHRRTSLSQSHQCDAHRAKPIVNNYPIRTIVYKEKWHWFNTQVTLQWLRYEKVFAPEK